MKPNNILLLVTTLLIAFMAKAQEIKQIDPAVTNLNDVNPSQSTTAQSYFFRTSPGWSNMPSPTYVNYGIVAGFDINSFHQIAFGNADDNMYLRMYAAGYGPWRKVWHSGNLSLPFLQWQDYIGNNVNASLNDMPANTSIFSYINGYNGINTNSPVSGPVAHFSGFASGGYGMQLQSNYLTGDLYTRVKNDDIQQWLGWRKVLSENAGGNVGVGTTTPSWYYHGGNNRVLEILNPNTEINSQSHIILSTGATTNFGSVGSVSFMAANATNNKGVAYIGATLTSDASINASGDLVFATANANVPLEKMRIDHNGNIGIGTATPAGKLRFQDVVIGSDPIGITWYNGGNNPTSYGIHRTAGAWNAPDYQQLRLGFETGIVIDPGTAYGKSYLDIQGNGIRVTNGSVGIATTDTKGYKLAVNGAAIFTKAVVKNYNNWPDYVFDSSYQLPSLDSVSTFIQANKHLPDMPSAATVEKDGHDLGEVQKLLLKKMEEMTLYMIEQNKKIANQDKEIAELKQLLKYEHKKK